MPIRLLTAVVAAAALMVSACGGGAPEDETPQAAFSTGPTIGLMKALSDDALEGRKAGTPGNALARDLIIERMKKLGVRPVGGAFEHPFTYGAFRPRGDDEATQPDKPGTNIMGVLPGSDVASDLVMVVTAHFDHLGKVDGEIYNGADDNASGVAGMLAVAEHFSQNPPDHDVLFVAFDAEEDGFGGARAFISEPPVPLERMAFNLNLDMIARGDNNVLWASGSAHWPALVPMIESVEAASGVEVKMGFDQGEGREDWTLLSDHAVFYRAGIPHLYLGVEDHPDYHKPSDDFDKIDTDWFIKSVETTVMMAEAADAMLAEISAMKVGETP